MMSDNLAFDCLADTSPEKCDDRLSLNIEESYEAGRVKISSVLGKFIKPCWGIFAIKSITFIGTFSSKNPIKSIS